MRKISLLVLVAAVLGTAAYLVLRGTATLDLPPVETSRLEAAVRDELESRRRDAESDATDAHILDYAIALHAHDLVEPAIAVYDIAAARAPSSFLPHYLAGVLIATTDPERAIPYFERSASTNTSEPLPHLRLGLAHETVGNAEVAQEAYERSLELEPQPETHLGLARLHLERGQPEEALERIEAALAESPREPRAWSLRVRALKAAGRHDEARRAAVIAGAFPQSRRSNVRDPHVRLVTSRGVSSSSMKWQANLASAAGRLTEALALMNRVVELRPDDADARFERGVIHMQMGRFEDAIADARGARELRDDWAEPVVLEGTALGNSGDLPAAREVFAAGVATFPDSAGLHSGLATAILRSERDKALHHCERALELDPIDRQAALQRARILAATSRATEARRQLAQLLELYPRDTDALALLTKLFVGGNNHAQALKTVQRLLDIDPNHAEGRRMLRALGG